MVDEQQLQKKRGRPLLDENARQLAIQKNRENALNRIREKYANDPEYRKLHLQKSKEYQKRCRQALKQLKEQAAN
jgi:hypothetical protein